MDSFMPILDALTTPLGLFILLGVFALGGYFGAVLASTE